MKRPRTTHTSLPPRMLMTILAASIVSVAVGASPSRLAVGIIVDGLQQEYIDMLREHLGPDGFNRFLNNGVVLENVDYGPNLDATAAAAVIMTGASPSVNGIGGETRYDPVARRSVPVLDDRTTVGNYTDETYSPRALLTSTITDEARIAGAGVTYAHSIAADPSMAIVLAGHAANSATWINDKTANWAGSTFYSDFPTALSSRNRMRPLSTRLDTMQWVPSSASASADFIPDHLRHYPFRYTFPKSKSGRVAIYKNSPLVNGEITDIAEEYIRTLELGKHDGTDILTVAYSLQPFEDSKTPENRYELIDAYIKLDAQLARLLKTIERQTGTDSPLVFLAATPPRNTRRRDDDKWNIPAGEFSTRKAMSLLNLYLIALHGNGEWVTAYNKNRFYLNHDLVKSRDKDIKEIREQAADFLKRMSGVERAYTIDAILASQAPIDNREAMRRNTVVAEGGDITIEVMPGWQILDDADNPSAPHTDISIHSLTTAPVYMLLPGVSPTVINTPVDARAIAPTITGQMRIRAPNGASVPALRFPSAR